MARGMHPEIIFQRSSAKTKRTSTGRTKQTKKEERNNDTGRILELGRHPFSE